MKEQLIKQITDEVVKYINEKVGNYIYIYPETITLEDVLGAVGNDKFGINGLGEMTILPSYDNYNVVKRCMWHLGKPLHEQPVETLEFIRDILK